MERLLEQEAPVLQVPGGSWGTQQRVPRHSYCQGTATGSPVPGAGYSSLVVGQQDLLLIPYFFPCPPSQPCCTMRCRRAGSAPVLTPSMCCPASRASSSPSGCVRVAAAAARIVTVRKNVWPGDCLLIPAGRVLVCVYSQQIPPTACSLAITESSRAGRLCSPLHPIYLNPSPLPCS